MDIHEGKQAWMVKIGEKGQFVIPKEAREAFGFLPASTVLTALHRGQRRRRQDTLAGSGEIERISMKIFRA